mgnify:CR=1 FL=1
MQKEIKQMWFFRQTPQEVWEYLTKPELIEQWLMKSDFQPIVGHKFRFIGGCNDEGNNVANCEVLEVKPYSLLSYSWQANSAKDNKPFDSKVVWTLVLKENGTELQLVHNGFTVLEDLALHNDGWTRCGSKIVELLTVIKE